MAKELKKKQGAHASVASKGNEYVDDSGLNEPSAMVRQPRVYKSTQEIDHDLFKLEVAHMSKNVSYTDVPFIERYEHVHVFHTVDSNGKVQTTSTPVGGHHHEVEVVAGPDGVPTLKVSQPRRWVKRKVKGVMKRMPEPIWLDAEHSESDEHTHEVTYLGSEKITLRTPNMEFAKFDANVRAVREPSIEGVTER